MTTDGFILVQYQSKSLTPQIIGTTVHNSLSRAEVEAATRRQDAVAGRRQVRISVARIEVLP